MNWHMVFDIALILAAAALAFRFPFELIGILFGAY